MRHPQFATALLALAIIVDLGCQQKSSDSLAPRASALASAKPVAADSAKFEVDRASSKASFLMDAPLEKISGEALKSIQGELFIKLSDVTQSSGLVKVDLLDLSIYQQQRKDEKQEYATKVRNDRQNGHMRTWFEISDDTPADVRAKNRYVEFKLLKVAEPSQTNVTELPGAERKITATVTGELLLHGRKTTKSVKVEASFKFEGDQPRSVTIKTLEPLQVGLDEHDVRPREAFGKLAQATLASLGKKVAEKAPVMLEFTAQLKP